MATSTISESSVEEQFHRFIKKQKGESLKLNGLGWPDRLVLLKGGKMSFVELKRRGKEARKGQRLRHKQLRRLGFKVYVIDRKEQFTQLLT